MATIDVEGKEQMQQNNAASESELERKHAAMLSRLTANHNAVLHKFAVRRAGSAAEANPIESTNSFLQVFTERCRHIQESLLSILERKSHSLSEDNKSSIKVDLENLALKVSEIEKFLADNSYFLPAYEVRTSQSEIDSLRDQIEVANVELFPKKKFSFKNKTSKSRQLLGENKGGIVRTGLVKEEEPKARQESAYLQNILTQSACGIHDMQNSVLVKDLHDQEDAEYVLHNLVNCRVFLRGRCRALYIHKLQGCHVYAGPVTGSVLIEEVEDSVLMLASHQIRIHQTKMTDLYLRVRSRPIVEYTSGVRFAPFAFYYHGIEEDLLASNLAEETGLWENVDDFRWLRAVASPNWSVLAEDQRLPVVDGSVVQGGKS